MTSQAQQHIITKSINQKTLDLAKLHKLLEELELHNSNEPLIAEDTKFGIIDPFFFEKAKQDKNGIYCGIKTIQISFDTLKELIEKVQKTPSILEKKIVIAYQPINDNYHYIFVRKFNINKDNLEKYLLLL